MPDSTARVGKIVKVGATHVASADAITAVRELVSAAREYGQIRQTELTRRSAIAAQEHMQVDRIRAAEEVLKLYFEREFEERAKNSKEMFARLDQAMDTGDPQMVHAVVRGIVDLAQSSPLSGLADFGKFWAELGTEHNPVEL